VCNKLCLAWLDGSLGKDRENGGRVGILREEKALGLSDNCNLLLDKHLSILDCNVKHVVPV
jgi:hypothetical protein